MKYLFLHRAANHLLLGMVIDRGPKLNYAEDEATVRNALHFCSGVYMIGRSTTTF